MCKTGTARSVSENFVKILSLIIIILLIPFSFSTTQTYVLEFGHLYMRVIKDGGHVLEPEVVITGATAANPVVITTSGAHGYLDGDEVFIDNVAGMTEINNLRFIF